MSVKIRRTPSALAEKAGASLSVAGAGRSMTLTLLVAAAFASGVLIGFIPSLVDSLRKSWQSRLNHSPERLEWGVRLFYFCWLPGMPAAGWILDQWPNLFRETLFFGLLGIILSLAWLGMVRSVTAFFANMAALGVAYSAMTTSAIRLMPLVFFPDSTSSLAALNCGFVAVAIGAWLGPTVVGSFERWWGYRQALLYLSLACIVPAALSALSERDQFRLPTLEKNATEHIFTHPHMALLAGIILLYFAVENCLEFWPEVYLKELGYKDRGLPWGMLVFWIGFIVTRGAAAWWFHEHPRHGIEFTLVLVIISAMLLGNLVGGYDFGSGSFGFWLVGACYGPMLPSFLGMSLDVSSLPCSALGILLGLSGLDTLIVRPLMAAYAGNRPARTAMRVPAILALIMAAPLLVLAFLRS